MAFSPASRVARPRVPPETLARAAELAALAVGLAIALVAWTYFVYAHPSADDFAVAVQGRELGAAGYANFIYATQSGRWTGHALLALVLGHAELTRVYPLLLAAVALASLGASVAFLRTLFGRESSWRALVLGALCFQALAWAGAPAIGQTFYWFSGAIPYQLGVTCAVLVVTGLVHCSRRGRAGVLGWAALPLVALGVPGLQELTGMMLAVALAAGAWAAFRLRLATRGAWVWNLAWLLAGCAWSVLAPGNSARASHHPEGGDVLLTLRYLGLDGLRAARDWFLEPRALAAAVLLWLSPAFRRARPRWTAPPQATPAGVSWSALVALSALASLAIGLAGPRWATGTWQPPRMLAATYMVALHAGLALLFLATRGERGLPRSPRVRAGVAWIAALVLAAAAGLGGNGRAGLGDLVHGRPERWARSRERRYELAREARARGETALVVPRPPYPPRVFVPTDVGEDPSYWENVYAAKYFELESIRLAPPEPSPEPPRRARDP